MTPRSPNHHREERSDEAIHIASIMMDCFAEPVIGRAFARSVGSQDEKEKGQDRAAGSSLRSLAPLAGSRRAKLALRGLG
jgi:hypothetical protein